MKTVYLLALTLFLSACAPTVVDPFASSVPRPEILTESASEVGTMTAKLNGDDVALTFQDDVWLLDTDTITLGLALAPKNSFASVDKGEFKAYSNDNILNSTIFAGDVLDESPTGFGFSLVNKTQDAVKILWDDSAIILPNGSSSRVIHLNVKYSEMNNAQPPTVIPPGARTDEYAGPTTNIALGSSKWIEEPLFGTGVEIGEAATLYLTLELSGQKQNLAFTFQATREVASVED
jgi:hypothetical protein